MDKRGVSELIATVLLIAVTIAAAGVIYAFVRPIIVGTLEGAQKCSNAELIIVDVGDTCYDSATGQILIEIARGNKDFELSGIQVTIEGEKVSGILIKDNSIDLTFKEYKQVSVSLPGKDEARVYLIDANALGITNPLSVSIAALVKVQNKEQLCSPVSKVSLGSCANTKLCIPKCRNKECGDDGCEGKCSPDTKPCSTEFGSCVVEGNIPCIGIIYGECSSKNQDPRTANCAGKQCGSDGCGGKCGPDTKPCSTEFGSCVVEGNIPCIETTYGECSSENQDPRIINCQNKQCGSDGCGGSCAPGCSGGTPYCVNYQCKQCAQDADCALGYVCISNQCQENWTYIYTADNVPNASSPSWTFSPWYANNVGCTQSAFNSILYNTVKTGSFGGTPYNGSCSYKLSNANIPDPNSGYTIEARIYLPTAPLSNNTRGRVELSIYDGANFTALAMGCSTNATSSCYARLNGNALSGTYLNWLNWHTYRIIRKGQYANVTVDGTQRISQQITSTSALNQLNYTVSINAPSSPSYNYSSQLDYIRFRPGI